MASDEDSEKRLQRAMDRLFSTLPSSNASSISPPSKISSAGGAVDRNGNMSPLLLNSIDTEKQLPSAGCHPWDRSDLLKRLATFKSVSWFGKPHAAGPISCARRGWVNVDLDLIACEECGSRLSFSTPPNWPKQQVEKAALEFSEKLNSGHKSLCPWRENACVESLAQFPPTSITTLVESYNQRRTTLSNISALPLITSSAIERIKSSRRTQFECLLTQHLSMGNYEDGENPENDSVKMLQEKYESYQQALCVISLCGWDARCLSYSVEGKVKGANESGPSVSFVNDGKSNGGDQPSDPASVVLDCGLCGASVGLWNFTCVSRSLVYVAAALEGIRSATTGVKKDERKKDPEPQAAPPQAVGFDLNLTIAGGPRPTRLLTSSPAIITVSAIDHRAELSEQQQQTLCKRKREGDGEGNRDGDSDGDGDGDGGGESKKLKTSTASAVEVSYGVSSENIESPAVRSSNVISGIAMAKEFDPIHQHRYFCPWVNGGDVLCGWQLTLDALLLSVKNQSCSSSPVMDPVATVQKILGGRKAALLA